MVSDLDGSFESRYFCRVPNEEKNVLLRVRAHLKVRIPDCLDSTSDLKVTYLFATFK